MLKRTMAVLLTVLLAFTGCSSQTESNEKIENEISYSATYFYSFAEDVNYATQDIQKKLNDFGEISIIQAADPTTETFTEIPKPENDAKAVSPVHIVMPELDWSKYSEPYIGQDRETGLEVWACYRVVADMLTDELVKAYVDSDGNIVKYETVNLGKYDDLGLDEKQIERKCGTFKNEIQQALGASVFEFLSPVEAQGTQNYVLFTDTQGNVAISTDASLKDTENPDQSMIRVHFYAVLTQLN